MRVGITGAYGFFGWYFRTYLYSLGSEVSEIRLADKSTFSDTAILENFVTGLDVIFHLAGVNRAKKETLLPGNTKPASELVNALTRTGSSATVVFTSSIHAVNPTTCYGEAKMHAAEILRRWASESGNRFINLIIPHVFGEYCKPFYNSGVATICYQITHQQEPEVNPNGKLELVYIQDLVELVYSLYPKEISGDYRVRGFEISVPSLVAKLRDFEEDYLDNLQIPDLGDDFSRNLFNTFRSFIDEDSRIQFPTLHSDNRGWLVETVRAGSGGQCFVSSTQPGITRGNHYHRRKVERFFVLQGTAEIKMRKLFSDDVFSYSLDGSRPAFIDIPTLYTHNITNSGDEELITLFWADELFDPDNPDTFYEEV